MTKLSTTGMRLLPWFITGLVFTSTAAFAQTEGRVLRDQSMIWRIDSAVPAASVPAGTILEVVAVRDDGYAEVLIPEQFGGRGERGRISTFALELLPAQDGARATSPQIDRRPRSQERVTPPGVEPTPGSDRPARTASGESAAAFRGFGSIGLAQFAAGQSFEAIFGDARGFLVGGGAQLRFGNGMFVQGSVDHLSKKGQRVVVLDGTVYPLGIENTVTMMPLHVAAGYRARTARSIVPYGGGGISFVRLTQTTDFDLPDEKYSKVSRGWNAIGGVEFRVARSISMAGELRYEHFSDALGSGGVSQVFNERNLGGMRTQFKVIVGR
jgi:opacity protein-like surface antigen